MRPDAPTRRRVITIFAAAAASAVTGGPARPREADYDWRGVAMGADATILFSGVEPKTARSAIAAAAAEIDRLEDALEPVPDGSELRRLNREKVLHSPSGDLRRALALALDIADRSGGLFDPSVQALWEAHVDWFAAAPDAGLPPDGVIARARAAVDWRRILDRARHDPHRRRSTPHAQRPRPGLCHRPGRGPAVFTGPEAYLRRSRRAARDRATSGRRAMAGRARQCRAVRTDQRRACDLGGCGLRARRIPARRIICSTRAAAAAPRTGRKSPCIIAPQPSPTRCRPPSTSLQSTKSKPCSRASQEPSYGPPTTTNANGDGFRRRSMDPSG